MKLALMVIDMQKAFYTGSGRTSMDAASEYINAAVDMFRLGNLPVLWVQDKDDVKPGDEGFELIDSLKPSAGEHRIIKEYGNSFNKTECDRILKEEVVDTVIITGYCAEYCVLSTYRGALDLDYVPILFRGALASGKEENIRFVESISDIVSYNVLKKMVGSIRRIRE